jgi:hypothetical protein
MPTLRWVVFLAAAVCAASAFAQSREPAGHILWAFGQVERVGADGAAGRLAQGDPVFEGDLIRTAPGSSAQLVMRDEALIALRAESSFRLAKYSYQGVEDGTERALVELLKGGVRSITGAIGRTNKGSYQLRNEGHVIGIRGTDHETYAIEGGTYNRVTVGGTYLQSAGGRVDLAPGEVGFVSMLPGSAPLRLERTPEFMHLAALAGGNAGLKAGKGAEAHKDAEISPTAAPLGHIAGPMGPATLPVNPAAAGSPAAAMGSPATARGALPAVLPVLPSRASGDNGAPQGFGRGGRCDGPCADPLKGRAASPAK